MNSDTPLRFKFTVLMTKGRNYKYILNIYIYAYDLNIKLFICKINNICFFFLVQSYFIVLCLEYISVSSLIPHHTTGDNGKIIEFLSAIYYMYFQHEGFLTNLKYYIVRRIYVLYIQ